MFQFKQFTIRQDRCPMKVGTDAVLLGAWAEVRATDRHILDIGTGTGILALMLAQRSVASITGIDISDVSQARENAADSAWSSRINFMQCAVQQFESIHSFDLIISNPPYFVASLLPPDAGRMAARHTTELPFEALRDAVLRLLSNEGHFALILPVAESARFESVCRGQLSAIRRTEVHTTLDTPVKRVLTEYARHATAHFEPTSLVIGTGTHEEYTAQYRNLTCDFYLKF
ncbi:MAG: methyltransferase domain-containing protein [Alistipes sp.]